MGASASPTHDYMRPNTHHPKHSAALSFFNAMLERYPERLNPGALWSGAQAPLLRTKEFTMTVPPRDALREGWGAQRSRVITWHDPAPTAAIGASMSGLEYLQAIVDRRLPPPPMGQVMRFDFLAVEPGRVVFACELDESAYNPIGVVHGGLVCTLLDSVAGCALHSALPADKGYTSVEIKVNYLRAVRLSSGLLTATGTVVKAGRRVGFTEGVVTDSSGALVATASSTLIIFDTNDASR
jgi:uncharacterized protein (TIGR00369 family)